MKTLAIVGRPNVGKSTLFNRLTRSRSALVYDKPGVTRDRQYGHAEWDGHQYVLVDTGGIGLLPGESLADDVIKQTQLAIDEADLILFMVDARSGAMPEDFLIVEQLRGKAKPVLLVINKVDGLNEAYACNDFYQFGLKEIHPISASNKQGIVALTGLITACCPSLIENIQFSDDEMSIEAIDRPIKVAIIGRPNAGKSTLINRMLKDDRLIVSPEAGTTRDSIYVPFSHQNQDYVLIDTAGVRRKSKVKVAVEKFSVIKTLKAIDDCYVAVMLFNAQDAIVDQDLHLLGYILEAGKSLVIAVNKWDDLSTYQRDQIIKNLDRKLHFVNFAKQKFISALHGTGVGELYPLIKRAYRSAFVSIKTADLNVLLQSIVENFAPPLVSNRRVKFRYAHIGGHNPPTIVIHGSRVSQLSASYQRYLSNAFRAALKLEGTPIMIKCRETDPLKR